MKKWINLNYFRAIACIWVMTVHLGQRLTLPNKIQNIFEFGSSGVIVFFVLSGFLAFHSYHLAKLQDVRTSSWLIKHFTRILPVYYAIIILYIIYYNIILNAVPVDKSGIGWFRYLLFLNQIIPTEDSFWSNLGGTWTISVFLLYYLFIPFFYKLIKNYNHAFILFIIAYIGSRLLDGNTEWFNVLNSMYYISIGIIIYFVIKEKRERHWTMVALLLLLGMMILDSGGGLKIGILISIMIVQSIDFKGKSGKVEDIINVITKYSYSIYLVHLFVVNVISNLQLSSNVIIIVIFIVFTTILSWSMYNFVEVLIPRIIRSHK